MRYRLCSLFIVLCLLFACKSDEGDGIPPAKMQKILYDMNAAEVYSGMVAREPAMAFNRGKNSDSLALYYNEILAHHKVSREQFDKSMTWYKSHPDRLDSIYNKMVTQLSKEGVAPAKR